MLTMASVATSGVWWVIAFWDCTGGGTDYSINILEGFCSVDVYGGNDDSICISWDDTNTWDAIDSLQGTNTAAGAKDYQAVHGLSATALSFSVVCVLLSISQLIIPKGHAIKTISRIANFLFGALASFFLVIAVGIGGNTDISQTSTWDATATTCTSSSSMGYSGFWCAIIGVIVSGFFALCIMNPSQSFKDTIAGDGGMVLIIGGNYQQQRDIRTSLIYPGQPTINQ
jgi:hypothetical protein